ncbi:MAG TPA: sulfate ABC transporter permease subunit CysT [Thermoleophilaceae bacterium]
MAAEAALRGRPAARRAGAFGRSGLGLGLVTTYLGLVVLIPLAAVTARAFDDGVGEFVDAVTAPQAVAALKLTLISSAIVAAVNAVAGTAVAWVLVRDRFRGRRLVDALIDLPFALPTIVAGLTLLALYGPKGPVGVDVAFSRAAVVLALLFVTLPFVVRSVQPVIEELDPEAEEAARSLGAGELTVLRRVVLPALLPAIVSGAGLALGRALGEFGSVVLISGNLPYETEVASVFVFGRIETGDVTGAAAVSVVLLAASLLVLTALSRLSRPRWTR